jgi:hypothetical protein
MRVRCGFEFSLLFDLKDIDFALFVRQFLRSNQGRKRKERLYVITAINCAV